MGSLSLSFQAVRFDNGRGTRRQAAELGYNHRLISGASFFGTSQKSGNLLAAMTAAAKLASSFCSHSAKKSYDS